MNKQRIKAIYLLIEELEKRLGREPTQKELDVYVTPQIITKKAEDLLMEGR